MISQQSGAEPEYLRGFSREDWTRRELTSEKKGGVEWSNNIGDEQSEKGGSEIEYQRKKSKEELEEWSRAITAELPD